MEPDDVFGGEVNFASRVGSASTAAEIWISDTAMMHIQRLGGARHAELRWRKHPGLKPKGFDEPYTLWSLSPNGLTLAEIAAANAQQVPPTVAETNIPAGMVPLHFMGRDTALDAIETALAGGGKPVAITAPAPSVTALHGLRGVGKTVLAAAYAERHRADYRAIWWVRAETDAGLRADLAGLAVRLEWAAADAAEAAAVAAAVRGLREQGEGILVVFDNARDPEALRPFLPGRGASRVIVTSNAPHWRGVAAPVEIRIWPKETGGAFLLERTGRPEGERQAAEALSEALGGLPLALEMAAAYCDRTGMSLAEYCRRLATAPAALLDSGRDAPEEYHDRLTVAKTFELAIAAAAAQEATAEIVIRHAALLPPEPIPRFLFAEGMAELFPGGCDEAVAAMRGYALVDCESVPDERDPALATDTIRLHRLVREVALARLDDTARDAARALLIAAMAKVYPYGAFNDPASWPRVRRLDAAALALVGDDAAIPSGAEAAAGYLMTELALYRNDVLAAYAPAEELYRRTLALGENTLGPDHPEVATCLNNLANLLRDTNRPDEAEPLYRRALAIDEKALGPDHPDVATDLNNLAGLLRATNRPGEAEPLYRRALAIDEKALRPDHPEVATRLNNLANLLSDTNRLGEAEPLFRRALAIDEKALGPEHPGVAIDLNNLANLLRSTNRPGEAEPLFRRALAIDEKALGPDHPNVAIRLNNLADLLHSTNRPGEAEPLLRRALAIGEKALGPDHPNVAIRLNNLAGLLRNTNRPGEAEPLFHRALAIDEKALGPDHPNVAIRLNNLAILLRHTNRPGEAEPLYRRALAIMEASLGAEHPNTLTVRQNLAILLDREP